MNTINDSRSKILYSVARNKPKLRACPTIPKFSVAGSPLLNFISHLKGFDGCYNLFLSRVDAVEWMNKQITQNEGVIFSAAPGVEGNIMLQEFATPADMHIIEICIAEALAGIGETGSLLVSSASLGSAAAALFSTHLYLFIDKDKIIDSLQNFYSKIDLSRFQYSSLFSGPSATADIEAVHITGAQGEISLTALVYNCTPEDAKIIATNPDSTPMAPAIFLKRESNPNNGQDSI